MQFKNSEFIIGTKAHQTAAVGDCVYQCAGSCSGIYMYMQVNAAIVHQDAY